MVLLAGTGDAPDGVGSNHYIRNDILQTIELRSFEKKRSILIEAQAGQGKTTIARQYLTHVSSPAAWFPLSPEDSDAVVLIERLYLLLKQSVKGFSCRLIATMLAKGEISYQAGGKYARILLRDLKKAIRNDLYIVFDDLHLIEDSPASLKFIEAFVSGLGSDLHFILISRHRIPRQVRAVFQACHCVYLDTRALAFSKKETREFVHECMELPLSRTQLNRLYETTHGWIMGLKSTCFSLQANGSPGVALGEVLQGDVELDFQYFAEEVYPFMAPVVTDPILKLALLEEVPLKLAAETSGDAAIAEKISYLYRNNFFISLLGDNGDTFAFHHLFRDFLRKKCREHFPPAEIAQFLNSAGDWYEGQEQIEKALGCFLMAENPDEMEATLERHGLDIYRKGRLYCCYQILSQLPDPISDTRCWTSFFMGLLSIELAPASSTRYLEVARSLFASQGNLLGELLSSAELCFNHIFIDGRLKSGKAIFPRANELFMQLREDLSPFYLARTANALAISNFYYYGDTDKSETYAALSKKTARTHDMRDMLAEAHTTSCFNHMGRGKFLKSAEELDAQWAYYSDPRVNDSTKFLGRLTQLNQLEITGDFINYNQMKPVIHRLAGTEVVQSTVLQGFTTVWETCQALAKDDVDHAFALIRKALAGDKTTQSPHLRSQFHHYEALIYGLKQRTEEALEAASRSLALRQVAQAPYFITLQAMVLGAMHVQLRQYEEARQYLARALKMSQDLRETFIRCAALSHRAFMNLEEGDTDAALADTRTLLALMQKEQYTHFDTWMPRIMLPVLRFAHRHSIEPKFVRKLAAERLNISFGPESHPLPTLSVTTLGPVTFQLEGKVIMDGTQLSQNEQRLLSAIICSPSLSITIHEAFGMLWPASDDEKAMKALKVMLFRMRKKCSQPENHPAFDFQDYLQHKNKQLFLSHCRIDAHDFLDTVSLGLTHYSHHHHWQAANAFRRALLLWNGPFLKSIAGEDSAGEFNDRHFLNRLSQAATSWSSILKSNGEYIREDLALIETAVSYGAGTPEMMRNLLDIHAATGDTRAITRLTQLYRKALHKAGYTHEEIEEELDGLWAEN